MVSEKDWEHLAKCLSRDTLEALVREYDTVCFLLSIANVGDFAFIDVLMEYEEIILRESINRLRSSIGELVDDQKVAIEKTPAFLSA